MKMFLWSVGSFHVFGEKVDLTWFLPVRFHFFEENMIFKVAGWMQSSIMGNLAKGFYILEKSFYIFEKGVYIFEEGAHLSKERQTVQIMQIRWLDIANHTNKVPG